MEELAAEILTEAEKKQLEKFAENEVLLEIIKKYVLAVCYKQGVVEKGREHVPTRNWAMNLAWGSINGNGTPRSDEELGQNLRALTHAVQLVGSGFNEIAQLKKVVKPLEEKNNPAE